MSDIKSPARKTPPPRRPFPTSPPQGYQHQIYSPINGSQNIPPPAYSPLPSIDSYEAAGPEIGPDGQTRAGNDNAFISDGASTSSLVEEAGPGLQSPPVYTEKYGELDINQDGIETRAQISGSYCSE